MGFSQDELRQELRDRRLQTIVVKIGSQSFTAPVPAVEDPQLREIAPKKNIFAQERVGELARNCAQLTSRGYRVILVSSGAILAGRTSYSDDGLLQKSREMAVQQALSALGQPLLMGHYLEAFSRQGVRGAQVLLTHEDLADHRRSLNLKNMLHILLERGVIPVINENDSVSFEEITVGDNDQLAAMVAVLMEADLLVMLTTPDGLYSQDPGAGPAEIIRCVEATDPLLKVSTTGKSAAGRGGMGTKLQAVRKATPFGIPVVLVTAREPEPITRALTRAVGTFFKPKHGAVVSARKKKLATLARTQAEVIVDAGAARALEEHKSLLPSGIRAVHGQFRRGDSVKILFEHETIAIGLSEYSAQELRKIKGQKSDQIESLLGACPAKVAFHKDNLYLVRERPHDAT